MNYYGTGRVGILIEHTCTCVPYTCAGTGWYAHVGTHRRGRTGPQDFVIYPALAGSCVYCYSEHFVALYSLTFARECCLFNIHIE